ncbi:MAG: hypothetical protein AAF518_28735 [Spirochaetota bacterium]
MNKEIHLSLTSKNSHKIFLPLGQGSLAIGTMDMDKKLFDVLVEENAKINWDAFNTHFTGHGEQNKDKHLYGDWPRFFYYSGDDIGFTKWTEKRHTEDFSWTPQNPVSANFTKSYIRNLKIHSNNTTIKIKLGKTITNLTLSGTIEKFSIQSNDGITSLNLQPNILEKETYQVPKIPHFENISSLDITTKPLGQPLDCKSLLQFRKVTNLSLSGNLTNLVYLQHLDKLKRLAIRYAPNLTDLPALQEWKSLISFIAWNVEESKGKLLRKELKNLARERQLEYSSVSQLRKTIWFTTEYGIPFFAWTGKQAKLAVKIYKATVKKLQKAKTETEIKYFIQEFTKTFNDFANIETTEREYIAEAVNQLRQVPMIKIDTNKTSQWFDECREY